MTNKQIVEAWINGEAVQHQGAVHCIDGVLYSYDVIIARRDTIEPELVHVNTSKHSRTTSKHQTLAKLALLEHGWEVANDSGTLYRKGA